MKEHNASELKEIIEVVSQTVPELLEKVNLIIGGQDGVKTANAVASFYSTLVKEGMPGEMAFELTRSYMSSMSLGGLVAGFVSSHR